MKGYSNLFVLTELVGFFVCENNIPRLYFGSANFFIDITKWSVFCPAEFRVMYTERSLQPTEIEFFKLDSLVLSVRPKCSSNGVFLVSECTVNVKTCSALLTLSRIFRSSSKFASIKFFSDWIIRSTNPVSVCRFAVPYTRSIFCD